MQTPIVNLENPLESIFLQLSQAKHTHLDSIN